VADKTTHFGRAGELFAMSELLLRGWNVAVPVADVGDDVFIVDDNDKTTYRVQVKSAEAKELEAGGFTASFTLSRRQLKAVLRIELFFMLLVRVGTHRRFLLIPRDELAAVRDKVEMDARPGRPMVPDAKAKTDDLNVTVGIGEDKASIWSEPFDRFLDQWPVQLSEITGGPGRRSR
jgi:hypothetical protein